MHQRVDADGLQRAEVQLLEIFRVGFEHHLELVVVLQAVGVLAVAAVGGATGGLHVGGVPGLRADGAQESGGVEGAGAHFHIVRLQHHTTLLGPVLLQDQDQVLEGAHGRRSLAHGKFTCWGCDRKGGSIPQSTRPPPPRKALCPAASGVPTTRCTRPIMIGNGACRSAIPRPCSSYCCWRASRPACPGSPC
ncbi:hypothetical protein D3C86_1628140 [compost metagenome]